MEKNIPQEFQDHPWINIFCTSRYIVVLYDEKGNPLWAANRRYHRFRDLVEILMSGPVQTFFDVPSVKGLNQVVTRPTAKNIHFHLIGKVPALKNIKKVGSFVSKNVIESLGLCPYFHIITPLTDLLLLKLKENRFLGIVSFRRFVEEIYRAENKMALFVDEHDRIFGFNSLFAESLEIEDPADLLGRQCAECMEFNRPMLYTLPDIPEAAFETFIDWRPDAGPLPFESPSENIGKLIEKKDGVEWYNPSDFDYSYIPLKKKLNIDKISFSFKLEFRSFGNFLPRAILRGLKYRRNFSPDLVGYTLSLSPEDFMSFKRHGDPVYNFALAEPQFSRIHSIEIKKIFNTFYFFCNDKLSGQWQEPLPAILPSDNLIYLFLRPNESMTIKSLKILTSPSTPFESYYKSMPLRARYRDDRLSREFNVSFYQRTVGLKNYTLYLFEDITDLRNDIRSLEKERDNLASILGQEKVLIGRSDAVSRIRSDLKTVAQSNLSVLIEGETGTGKEILAHTIHQESHRRDKPMVKIDCSAIPRELMESELFGHEKGAFTGAVSRQIGRFEQAEGGTVFLDEVANLSPQIQAKLLNVLQDFTIQRVGGTKTIRLDVRLIVASNIPLEALIAKGSFRQDLYYRLNQFRFVLPPLKSRMEDIPLLIEHFMQEANRTYQKKVNVPEGKTLDRLLQYAWPGNIRELRNIIQRAVLFCKTDRLTPEDIALPESHKQPMQTPVHEKKRTWGGRRKRSKITRVQFISALEELKGNMRATAKQLGIGRNTAYQFMRKYRLKPNQFRK
jgi:transcriptional regulator with PAS, ATPase and Fis domain